MKHLMYGVWVYALLLFSASKLLAQSANTVPELPAPADVRVIVDISGSMKINDPDNLRQPAVRLIARLLPEGTSAGIWTFGQYVNMLVPFAEVNSAWRQQALERSSQINSVALRTNLGEALEVASDSYLSDGDLSNTQFILLTDGKVDIDPEDSINETERQRVLGELLERIKASGARIHTVALSEAADLDLLTALASGTGGSGSVANDASELSRVFVTALNTAVPQEQLPIRGNGFKVDSGVEEFTALIFSDRKQGGARSSEALTLLTPSGAKVTRDSGPDNLRWVSESGYDLITVDQPQPGDWELVGVLGDGSRVTVVSDLRMVVGDLPARFYSGQVVNVDTAFYEDQSQITNPDFLGVMDVSLMLTTEDGRSGRKVLSETNPPADGVYRDVIQRLEQPGDYQIDLTADGQTFSRKFSGVITLRPPVRISVSTNRATDRPEYLVTVTPEHPELDLDASSVAMTVTYPDGEVKTSQVPYSPPNKQWQGAVTPEQGDGAYSLELAFTGATHEGTEVNYSPESFQARFPQENGAGNIRVSLSSVPQAPEPSSASGSEPVLESAQNRQPETPTTSEQPAEPPPVTSETSFGAVISEIGPIDISQVETPLEVAEASADQNDGGAMPMLWLAAAGGAVVLTGIVGGLLWWRKGWRKRRSVDEETPVVNETETPEDEPMPVLEDITDEPLEAPLAEEQEEQVPQLEPEPEVEEDILDEQENDFGLEDFDLSDIEQLPEVDEQAPPADNSEDDPDKKPTP
ncbi:MAG: VWA domain-containing protein [Marinobacter sp.]|uniref:VWA domain-containing protein n=1 Tax=Marinobacter sp. TaxID=50741 RepID=UPI0034A009D7